MKINTYLLIIASSVSFSVFSADKNEPHEDQLLLASCQALTTAPGKESAKSCIYFIKGFVATARAIDSSLIDKQNNKKYIPYRTKGRVLATRFMHFCVPFDESDASLTKTVSRQLSAEIDTQKMLRDMILNILITEYPCDKKLTQN